MEIENRLKDVFAKTFNVSEQEISPETRVENLHEWDSLGQLRLIMNVEAEFQISFHIEEIQELTSFETLLKSIIEKKSPDKI
ncbi:MAG: acyl carrier protein [Flavobacteriaceae bacterium]|jgi:acyl carrier protein|nr:acyl carrier protein [Flavobacteriaceae bacterium]